MIAELPRYRESKLLTPREKAAVRYAEVLAGDHKQAGPDMFDEHSEYFTAGSSMRSVSRSARRARCR